MPMVDEHLLIGTREACRMLRCSRDSLFMYIKQGYIKPKGKLPPYHENGFDYWDVRKLVGVRGKRAKNKRLLLDSRILRDTMDSISID